MKEKCLCCEYKTLQKKVSECIGFICPVCILITAVFVTKKASIIFEKLQKFLDKMYAVIRENITGVRVIKTLILLVVIVIMILFQINSR